MRHFTLILFILSFGLTVQSAYGLEDFATCQKKVWSGYWWPMRDGEILGPLSKYDQQYGKNSVAWEKENNPLGSADIPQWYGYCHAWSASAVLEPEPKKPVHTDSQELTIGDQKGLLAITHAGDDAEVYGSRYGEEEDDDRNDIEPMELWRVLKMYIQEQGKPIVADLEPEEQIWNYPIYAYRVRLNPASNDPACNKGVGTIEVWYADDSVPMDFVGLKPCYKLYTFEVQLNEKGEAVSGTGVWTGNSVQDHPDFLWYPLGAKPENPEVEYELVQKMVRCAPDPAPEPAPEPTPEPEHSIMPAELVQLIADQTSDFILDITVDRFDGGTYKAGEKIKIKGKSEQSGYLYLIGIAPNGSLNVLYPQKGDNNEVKAGQEFEIPGSEAKYSYSIASLPGRYMVKAIVTDKPLVLAGWNPEISQSAQTKSGSLAMDVSNFRWNPAAAKIANNSVCKVLNNRTGKEGETIKKLFKLTRFAQDEVQFIVTPSN